MHKKLCVHIKYKNISLISFQDQCLYVYHMVLRKDNGYAATLNQYRCYNISLRSNTSRTRCFITIVAHNRSYFYIDRKAPLVIPHRRNEIALNTRCNSLSCYSNFRYSARSSDVLLADIGNFLADVFTVSHAGNKESLLILMAHEWDAVCLRWTRRHSSFRNGLSHLHNFVIEAALLHFVRKSGLSL